MTLVEFMFRGFGFTKATLLSVVGLGGGYDLFNTSSLPNYGCLSTQYNKYVCFLYYLGNFQRNRYIRYEIV
jgi:hypothetical protein